MSSIDARNVAIEVVKNLGKARKIKLGEIMLKNGYSERTSLTPQNVTNTDSYKEIVSPFVEKMIRERDRMIDEMENKDLTKVQYDKLANTLDTFTKNIQLLTGGRTENNGIGELADTLNNWINSKR